MQVLQIQTTPMECELSIEHAQLKYTQHFHPTAQVETNPAKMQIKTEAGKLELDTYEARHSIGFGNAEDRITAAAQKGKDALMQYINQTVETGAQLARIEDGVSIGSIIKNRMQEMDSTYTAFLPSGGVQMQWIPNQITTQFEPGNTQYEWDIKENEYRYSPGNVHLKILQYPSVDIQYIGSPLYVPPSSAPDAEQV